MKQVINTRKAPQAIGPYSQAIKANGLIFCSGQTPLDEDGNIIASDISSQTKRTIKNLEAVLIEAGSSLDRILKTTIYLKNIRDLEFVNDIYETYFDDSPPARSIVEVPRLPQDVLIEIDCIAAE